MALTLAVTLLGVVLEDADLLALAVLDDLALHRSALHHGSAEGGFVAVQDGQDLVKLHGVAGFLVQAMTDYSFYNYRVMFLFWAYLGVGALISRRMSLPEGGKTA